MKALDTFRNAPHRHNCAQAIAYRWLPLFDDQETVAKYAPYVGGRAPAGYCGALYAAMQALPAHAREIERDFVAACGHACCREIKSQNRTPCEVCVDTADRLVEKYRGE